MLEITIPETEVFDEETQTFSFMKSQTLRLEHSLVSLSKWESKWQKPFLHTNDLSKEETIDYIRCMTLTQNVDPKIYYYLSNENIESVTDYIKDPMTATTFSDTNHGRSREIITSEVIYYWMIALQIPFECQKWHLNRLLTLINVCNRKNNPKKMSQSEILSRNRALNEARRKALKSKG